MKKSLHTFVGDVSKDKEELKQRVLYRDRKPKKKTPFPLVASVIVMAAVLFFTFDVLKGEYLDRNGSNYEVNEALYDLQLKSEQHEIEDVNERRSFVLEQLLQADSLIDYAKSLGYVPDEQAIENKLTEEQKTFFDGFRKEELDSLEQEQLKNFDMTYDQYFQIIHKFTIQFTAAIEWLEKNPPTHSKTQREVIDAFKKKNKKVISEFMEAKQIPSADKSSLYEEFEGLVAAIEDHRVLVVWGVEKDQIERLSAEEILDVGYTSAWFKFDETIDQIEPYMQIKVAYDPLSYPISQTDGVQVFENVVEWE
ncbi:DUF3221 domain-containing protein [Sporosarcina obsidiansis]|uniref:DUF3221 domain-containing protein n=1 Tax=Sporosarcina obsidiansis TaxID=2660748 RepID=UPI001E447087|nr:DUF3221 domain-containing protein [Sporosarcina obsidiansis]